MTPNKGLTDSTKVGCVFLMVDVSILHHVGLGPNDHREYTPHFNIPFMDGRFLNVTNLVVELET